ncbi:MAG TPA: hypothetical protein VL117_11335, partial [Thermoleophilia bacterium]|nr:hypothetical protein [Thermoleophilia bacterium]
SEKLDQIEREFLRRHPRLPQRAVGHPTTLAYLGLSVPGIAGRPAPSRLGRHAAWLEDASAAEIAASIDLDAYLALDVAMELATMERDLGKLEALRACLRLEAPDQLYACLESAESAKVPGRR